MQQKILIIGASGQIGIELTEALRKKYGHYNVIATDIKQHPDCMVLDALNATELHSLVIRLEITQIYLLAAMLSATGEQDPRRAWQLNMGALLNVLEVAREEKCRVFWPSSIAAAAPTSTVYGISKYAGECWCEYYFTKYGVDVRSLRYPGLISYKAKPGGGTTDYAIDIFHAALNKKTFNCFLKADTMLPMMYMPDAIRATIMLMDAPEDNITNRMSYDVGAMSFTPQELYEKIKAFCPGLEIVYEPDTRQRIADSWPKSIGDLEAREDWGWMPMYNLTLMVHDMLEKLEAQLLNNASHRLEKMGQL